MARSSLTPSRGPEPKRGTAPAVRSSIGAVGALMALPGCAGPGVADVAIVGLEGTTYVNGSLTFPRG